MTTHSLFASAVLKRLDEILAGTDVPWPASDIERRLLLILREHVGKSAAITRAWLVRLLELPDREVRELIRSLRVDFGVAIGTNRSTGNSGYYLVSSVEEMRELTGPLIAQGTSIFRLLRSLTGRHNTAEILGQARLELGLDLEAEAIFGTAAGAGTAAAATQEGSAD